MKPIVRFVPGELIVKGQSVYRSDDLMLIYEGASETDSHEPAVLADVIDHRFGLDGPVSFLLIADTMTLTFSGLQHCLTDLDVYTNRALWHVSPMTDLPNIRGQGILVADPSSFESDRCSLSAIPRPKTSENEGRRGRSPSTILIRVLAH